MGQGPSKLKPLLPAVIALTLPVTSLSVLDAVQRRLAALGSHRCAAKLPDALKVLAGVLFSVGHSLQCLQRPLDSTDWCYILGCTPFLTAAFAGNMLGRPLPLLQFVSGALLFRCYFPLFTRAKKASASTKLALIGLGAAVLLMWGGLVGMLVRSNILSKSPGVPLLLWALLTSMLFGTGNSLKLSQLLLQTECCSPRAVVLGQLCKVCVSASLKSSYPSAVFCVLTPGLHAPSHPHTLSLSLSHKHRCVPLCCLSQATRCC